MNVALRESVLARSASDRLRLCIASDVGQSRALYNGLVYEACEALAEMTDGDVLTPGRDHSSRRWKAASLTKRALTGMPLSPSRPVAINGNYDLFFYICMRPDNLIGLKALKGWRDHAGMRAAFLFETWSLQAHRYRHYLRMLDDFDHVFLFNPNSVREIQRYTKAKCSYLPAGIDCLMASPFPNPPARVIDVYGMGRTNEAVHEQLVQLTREGKLFYLWDRGGGVAVPGLAQARLRTYHAIRHSRMFTSFNFRVGSKTAESGGEEAIPARVFEGAAGGAILIGSAPDLPEFGELFDWPDAFFELNWDQLDVGAFYAELQAQPERLRTAGIRNAAQSLRKHDWAYRWESMLTTLGLPVPPGVELRKGELARLATIAEASL